MTVTLTAQTEARLQELAARRGQAPETVIDDALDTLLGQSDPDEAEEDLAEQARLRSVLAELSAQAQARTPGSGDPAARQAYRDAPQDDAIVEKYQRMGFNL